AHKPSLGGSRHRTDRDRDCSCPGRPDFQIAVPYLARANNKESGEGIAACGVHRALVVRCQAIVHAGVGHARIDVEMLVEFIVDEEKALIEATRARGGARTASGACDVVRYV